MSDVFKPVRDRRKKAPVKRVIVSAEAKRAYEALVEERDEKERAYGTHLPEDTKRKG